MTMQLSFFPFTGRLINAGLHVLVAGILWIGAMPFSAVAQSDLDPNVASADATVHELVQQLTSPINEVRNQALERITDLAQLGPEVDLKSAIPALVEISTNDPDEMYRLWAVATLHAIGDETGMQHLRKRFMQEPSLVVQYVSVCTLIDRYGPKAFGRDKEATMLARNVLARKAEVGRLIERHHLRLVPRVKVGPLEVVESDSLQRR